jgi:hypothetical protein
MNVLEGAGLLVAGVFFALLDGLGSSLVKGTRFEMHAK